MKSFDVTTKLYCSRARLVGLSGSWEVSVGESVLRDFGFVAFGSGCCVCLRWESCKF